MQTVFLLSEKERNHKRIESSIANTRDDVIKQKLEKLPQSVFEACVFAMFESRGTAICPVLENVIVRPHLCVCFC